MEPAKYNDIEPAKCNTESARNDDTESVTSNDIEAKKTIKQRQEKLNTTIQS